ncbi:CCA tRNA nucleotidyltransferase [Clostridium thermobutyricum]|uniref:CCA-adding enzyme n=1 Tax=Clostridium thermobutyricum DSM 4928 TaxID=1121339 RepID=A0A1V4SSY3_9CLOT|nr:CCA tRNA nucleotidyltransferase [Clostridium thermobutyricum]OPX46962.1 CCA-adding enzyme [Clostridium thermobutyricum DSM 4928]
MNFNIPAKVQFIIDTFYNNGFEAFLVGGCIRDYLLNKTPKDYDIATSATPDQTIYLFEKTIPTGLQHGTVTVVIENENFEVTTYRTESEYIDNRHPEKVEFVKNIKEDLSRRDFTINAFAYNHKKGLLDFFEGKSDLKNKIIRAVGNSDIRFNEDALRMLRAIRFSSQLDFDIAKDTLSNIEKNNLLINNISFERIRDEISKILLSNNPRKGLILLKNTELLTNIIPEFKDTFSFDQKNPHHFEDVFEHSLSVVEKTPSILTVRLAALLHDIGKPSCFNLDEKGIGHFYGHNTKSEEISRKILNRLRFDNKTIKETLKLIREHMNVLDNPNNSNIKRLITRVGLDSIENLYSLQEADILSLKDPSVATHKIVKMREVTNNILISKEPLSLKDLAITGNDLINELGLSKGKIIGDVLKKLFNIILDYPDLNNKKDLLKEAKKIVESYQN